MVVGENSKRSSIGGEYVVCYYKNALILKCEPFTLNHFKFTLTLDLLCVTTKRQLLLPKKWDGSRLRAPPYKTQHLLQKCQFYYLLCGGVYHMRHLVFDKTFGIACFLFWAARPTRIKYAGSKFLPSTRILSSPSPVAFVFSQFMHRNPNSMLSHIHLQGFVINAVLILHLS